jgi:predicted  nucleic acid-binding Zn-ribbon protein|tara:strand:- start:127 stop:351 length:225 start_codon:yes stop_codon:yes gene_type:complete
MNVKDYAEYKMKKEDIEKRKTALQNQHDDVNQKISQGRNALGNLEATLMGLKGAISQIDWVLGLFVDETNKKDK